METVCEYTDDVPYMTISTDERKWIRRLLKMAEAYPNDVEIIARPETNDGCLYLKCPKSYLKITPRKSVNLSDEERFIRRERLLKYRKNQ